MSPVDHVLAAGPRVQRRKKIKRRWRTLHRVYHSLFIFWYRHGTKKRLFPLPPLSVRDKGKGEKKRYGGRVSTNYSTRVVGIVDIEGRSTD